MPKSVPSDCMATIKVALYQQLLFSCLIYSVNLNVYKRENSLSKATG